MFEISSDLIVEKANGLLGDLCPWRLQLTRDDGRLVAGVGLRSEGLEGDGALRLRVVDSIPPDSTAPLCVPPRECSLVRAYELLQTAFDQCRTWYEECLYSICQGADIDAVADAAAMQLTNPVACFDDAGALVCRFGAVSNGIEPDWESIVVRGYADSHIAGIADQTHAPRPADMQKRMIEGAFEGASAGDPAHRYVIIPLVHGEVFQGSLVSVDVNETITPGQKEILRLAGQLMLLVGRRKAADDTIRGSSYYVRRLLEGEAEVKRSAAEHHFARLGWAPDDLFLMYRFEVLASVSEAALVDIYKRQLRELLPDALWVNHEGGLVALGRKEDFDATDALKRKQLARRLSRMQVVCGISSCTIGFMDALVQHTQCRLALRACRAHGNERVGYFDELYPSIVSYELDKVSNMRSLCHPAVLRLAESDQEQDGVRLDTLKSFLLNGRNVAISSRALGIHRNTMIYRLEKLEEAIGENLYDLDDSLLTYLLISCLLVK